MATPAYTFTQKTQPSEPGELNWFGNLRRDGSKQPLTGALGNGIQTTDATSTPQTSPLTVTTSAVVTLVAPDDAMNVLITSLTNTLNISEVSNMASYFTLPVNTPITLECGLQKNFYLESNTGNATVSFAFGIV